MPALQRERVRQESVRQDAEAAIEELLKPAGVQAPVDAMVGDPARVVHDEALRRGADLVVIGRGVLPENFGRLRTHTLGIIRNAPCPAISV